jgi:mannose-6-phosphate isomerase-like protein (cupin superfamily)
MTQPVVHQPGEGERIAVGPLSNVVHLASDDSEGKLCVSEATLAPGFAGPPLHSHEQLHDMFYVLEGTLTVVVNGQTIDAEPGAFVCVPPRTSHTFGNSTGAPVRFLNISAPGGFEHYMREVAGAAASGPPTPEQLADIASRHDFVAERG